MPFLPFDFPSLCYCHADFLEMVHIRYQRVPHPPSSQDFGICDFYLFGRIKDRLTRVTVIDGDDRLNEGRRV
jgi:hypothetical protein